METGGGVRVLSRAVSSRVPGDWPANRSWEKRDRSDSSARPSATGVTGRPTLLILHFRMTVRGASSSFNVKKNKVTQAVSRIKRKLKKKQFVAAGRAPAVVAKAAMSGKRLKKVHGLKYAAT